MRDFRELNVWQKAHALTVAVYEVTESFPPYERYGLTSQLRRSCSSIGANIAEGCGRGTNADLGRFLQIAMGSASETENHLLIARDLRLLDESQYVRLSTSISEVKRMLATLIVRVRAATPQR